MTSPAEELKAAAAKIRNVAGKATPGGRKVDFDERELGTGEAK